MVLREFTNKRFRSIVSIGLIINPTKKRINETKPPIAPKIDKILS
jgi:hypothetical protein